MGLSAGPDVRNKYTHSTWFYPSRSSGWKAGHESPHDRASGQSKRGDKHHVNHWLLLKLLQQLILLSPAWLHHVPHWHVGTLLSSKHILRSALCQCTDFDLNLLVTFQHSDANSRSWRNHIPACASPAVIYHYHKADYTYVQLRKPNLAKQRQRKLCKWWVNFQVFAEIFQRWMFSDVIWFMCTSNWILGANCRYRCSWAWVPSLAGPEYHPFRIWDLLQMLHWSVWSNITSNIG